MTQIVLDLLISFLTNDVAVWIEALKKKPMKYNNKAQLYLLLSAMETLL